MQERPTDETLDCELCVVGAGYAAVNGLNAAAKYLKKGARVVVVDENETWGGQWVRQYDFVRLHQPYQMFTAGDQPWALDRDPSHLATRREVLDHLASVPAMSCGHLEIVPLFEHVYSGHRIRAGRAEIEVAPITNADRPVRIGARRLLKATGADIQMLPPFPLSSTRVQSVGVSDPVLMSREFLESSAPVYIIGSGKTAMDCVQHLARHSPSRPLTLLIGSGMWFLSRDQLFPRGIERHTRGTLVGQCFLRMCELFDGHNEADVMRALERDGVVVNVFGHAANCRFGMLSAGEGDQIRARVNQVQRGHLVDVDGTKMTLREGEELREVSIAPGSWFINCTTHLQHFPHEPVLQDSGLVCAPQYAMGFTGASAYYLTHLWYRDELAAIAADLFRLRVDVEPRLRFAPHMSLMVMANTAMAAARLPRSIAANFHGDTNRWYPLHRRLAMLARVVASQRSILRKAERLLALRFSDSADASTGPERTRELAHRRRGGPAGVLAASG
jgi:hypothetical protein